MSKMSLIDKLGILWKISKSSYLFIIVLVILLILGFIFFTTNKRNYKRHKLIYIISLIAILTSIITFYHGSLSNIFDYMMNNLFIAIYFPNLAIYFAAIIITNIILWISLFNFRTTEVIKRVNIVVYIIINYLLALILSVINNNKLDVFNQSSVYGNNNARALIELSSLVFIVWIVFLIVYKIILTYIRKDYKPRVKKVIVKKTVKKLPDNYEPLSVPEFVYGSIKKKETIITEPIKSHIIEPIKEKIVEEEQKIEEQALIITPKEETIVIKEEEIVDEKPKIIATSDNLTAQFEQMLTVDDYKLLLRMLQEQKEKERLEKIRQEEQQKEEDKFVELQALYRGAR